MSRTSYRAALAVLACLAVVVPAASGQQFRETDPGYVPDHVLRAFDGGPSCAGPTEIPTAPYLDSGNTCGKTNDVDDYNNFDEGGPCSTFPYPGPDVVYRFEVDSGAQITVTLQPAAPADMGVFVVTDCNDTTTCVGFRDQIGGGAPSQVALTDLAGGQYFIWVDSYYASGAQSCGPYQLSVDGDVPTELIEFTVE